MKKKKKNWNYSSWYERNKERLAEERRRKYQKDKEYRTLCKQRAMDYYDRERRVDKPKDRKIVKSGKNIYYTIGQLAGMIHRDIQTIRAYHRNNVIPVPTVFDSRGWRLYSVKQANMLQRLFAKFDRGDLKSLAEVSELAHDKWNEGVNGKRKAA